MCIFVHMQTGSSVHTIDLQSKFQVYNALSRRLELFRPIRRPQVGMYVCGPTVYNDVHAGNIRTFLSFDVLQRFLSYIGYEVRYVRNITDVGHLTEEAEDAGKDKIEQAAKRLELEPRSLAERYTRRFHEAMSAFGIQPPQLEPRATAHIPEQTAFIVRLLEVGYAYEVAGSVYFDLQAYKKRHPYGQLSGLKTEELYTQTRDLQGQAEKRHPLDFALWKSAGPERLMQWDSPWGKGVPGWHLECSAMSLKYLGSSFDIHGGGMDLKFPHHECELAQAIGAQGTSPARYWMYTNMLTVEGEKMSKSAGNTLTYSHLIDGSHSLLPDRYSPMVLRFFMLQTHYSSPLDLSAAAIKAAQKGYIRLMNGLRIIKNMPFVAEKEPEDKTQQAEVIAACKACDEAMCQDLNTALALGSLFALLKKINALHSKSLSFGALGETCFAQMQRTYVDYVEQVLGLVPPVLRGEQMLKSILSAYKEAKLNQQHSIVDNIREQLRATGISLQDSATGEVGWSYAE